MIIHPTSQAILDALIYCDIFSSALTYSQLFAKLHSSISISESDFKQHLNLLVSSKLIFKFENYYALNSSNFLSTINRLEISKQKFQFLEKYLNLFKKIPYLKVVLVTGSLACLNSNENDDIDLMIIAKKNRLWLTRLILLIKTWNLRRYPHSSNFTNKFCFNIFIQDDQLQFNNQNIYIANEIVQAYPIFTRNNTYSQFLLANSWTKKYLANSISFIDNQTINHYHQNKNYPPTLIDKSEKENKPYKLLFNLLNWISYIFQYLYMFRKITHETISYKKALFHPSQTDFKVMSEFQIRKITQKML